MDPTTMPAEYGAVLLGAIALYGGLTFLITQLLRRCFPLENNAARLVAALVAVGLAAWAAVQHGLTILPTADPTQKIMIFIALAGGILWASQEIYRRIRADTWGTKAKPTSPWADQ